MPARLLRCDLALALELQSDCLPDAMGITAVAGIGAAAHASPVTTVVGRAGSQRFLPLGPEEGAVHAGVDVIPRHDLICRSLSMAVPVYVQAGLRHGLHPGAVPKPFVPPIEASTKLPGTLNHTG